MRENIPSDSPLSSVNIYLVFEFKKAFLEGILPVRVRKQITVGKDVNRFTVNIFHLLCQSHNLTKRLN